MPSFSGSRGAPGGPGIVRHRPAAARHGPVADGHGVTGGHLDYGMAAGNPDFEALWEEDGVEERVHWGWPRETRRDGGTVWLTGRYIREACMAVLLSTARPVSIGEVIDALARRRVRVGGGQEPHKAVSDALRYQVSIGRVVRVGRGCYAVVHVPPGIAKRVRRRLRQRSWPWAIWVADPPDPGYTGILDHAWAAVRHHHQRDPVAAVPDR